MSQYIARRLVQLIPVVFGITLILFFMLRLIPGDPASVMLGERATDAAVARINHELGLDQPIYVQYGYFLRDLATLNLGTSIKYQVPVATLLGQRLLVSLSVVGVTLMLTIVIALPLGMLAALKKDSLIDNVVRSLCGADAHAVVLGRHPADHLLQRATGAVPRVRLWQRPVDNLYHLFLPALTIALAITPVLVRALRSSILDALSADYVRTARAKGLRERAVITAHVLRNALIPAITLLGLSIGSLMGGTVILEKVFALPGAGALLIDSIGARDYPVVQAATMVFAMMVILVNLLTDIIYSFLDPRVRFG